MAEKWVTTERGKHLRGRRNRDTQPEVALRRALHAAGARFRLHQPLAPGCTPDLVLPGRRIAVFVDGDFWHGCPVHFPDDGRFRGPNGELWRAKIARTRARDRRATQLAYESGWGVVRIWECEIVADPGTAAERVLRAAETAP
jgi:DNA mismatch endonuclease, patch repair protein